jgi:hypothetical protein
MLGIIRPLDRAVRSGSITAHQSRYYVSQKAASNVQWAAQHIRGGKCGNRSVEAEISQSSLKAANGHGRHLDWKDTESKEAVDGEWN